MSAPAVNLAKDLDLQFIWMLMEISAFLAALVITGLLLKAVERRQAKHAAEKAFRDREEAYYRKALDAAARLDASWPPPQEGRR